VYNKKTYQTIILNGTNEVTGRTIGCYIGRYMKQIDKAGIFMYCIVNSEGNTGRNESAKK